MEAVIEKLVNAKSPEEIFGSLSVNDYDRLSELERLYRQIARVIHPDISKEVLATKAFQSLQCFYEEAKGKIEKNIYGKKNLIIIKTKKSEITLLEKLGNGEYSSLFLGSQKNLPNSLFIKISRQAKNNRYLENEAKILFQIKNSPETGGFLPYFPSLVDSFRYIDADKKLHQALALEDLTGFIDLLSLKDFYKSGLPGRHAGWIYRRLLVALGSLHRLSLSHGAVLPEHILVHPKDHGLVLIDFSTTGPFGKKTTLLEKAVPFSPPDVAGPCVLGPQLDIYQSVSVLAFLLGKNTNNPKAGSPVSPFGSFIKGCQLSNPRRRPGDAWALKEEFDELLDRLYGKRSYVELTIPPNWGHSRRYTNG